MRSMFIKPIVLLAGLMAFSVTAVAEQWVPKILPRYDVHNNPNAIDFRRAGFIDEERARAQWNRRVVELEHAEGDQTDRIREALDTVGADGGGTVRLGPGSWSIRPMGVRLIHSGVRLEGAKEGGTELYVPNLVVQYTTAVLAGIAQQNTFVGSSLYQDSWVRQEKAEQSERLTADAERNTNRIWVENPQRSVGDALIITGTPTAEFIAEHGMTGVWTTAIDYPAYLRTITAVLEDGYELDMPIRYPVRVRDAARCFPPTRMIRDISVANLSIRYFLNPGPDFDVGSPAAQTEGATALKFVNVENGLIENITMPVVASRGIELAYSRHITVRGCAILRSLNQNPNWNGYHYFVWGCDNLFRDNYSANARRPFSPLMAVSHGNVFHHNTSVSPRFGSDFHMHLSHENLIDSHVGIGDYWECVVRRTGSPIPHGVTGTSNTFWNIDSDQPTSVWSVQHDLGYVIGTSSAVRVDPSHGVAALPVDHVEGEGWRSRMTPLSIYLYQLGIDPPTPQQIDWSHLSEFTEKNDNE